MPWTEGEIVNLFHYACAWAIALLVAVTLFLEYQEDSNTGKRQAGPRISRISASSIIIATYIAESIITSTFSDDALKRGEAPLLHFIVAALLWTVLATRNLRSRPVVGTALLTVALEIPILVITRPEKTWSRSFVGIYTTEISRIAVLLGICALSLRKEKPSSPRKVPALEPPGQLPAYTDDETGENEELLGSGFCTETEVDNESIPGSDLGSEDEAEDSAELKKRREERLKETGGWLGYLRDFRVFVPFLIPRHDVKVQLCYLVCIICLIAKRVLNILVPRQLGIITDHIIHHHGPPYKALAIWLVLALLRFDAGVELVEGLAKIPIEQYSYRQVTNAAFNHVMKLPIEFHAEHDSAEIMRAIEQGNALTNLLRLLVLEITPTIIDVIVALVFLYYKFNIFASIVLLTSGVIFFVLQVATSTWNLDYRRASTKATREETRVMHQAVQGWLTVAYFNMFAFESNRFDTAVTNQLAATKRYESRSAILIGAVEGLVPVTFFLLASLVLYEISQDRASVGDLVFLMQYWDYIIWPMKFLSESVRVIMRDLVDAERLLALLQTEPSIRDKESAETLLHIMGNIAFENVSFTYDSRRPSDTIRDISIEASPGQTIALVGETGAGKSTIMKLLLRFYDVTSGRITLDGRDIRDITLDSLRSALGVVPQDPLLFNTSILENLRYARPTATETEIQHACRSAAIHNNINTFPDGYATIVGEQGIKLSGGEIQRLAIARVFLKDPPVLILDEATSAIDTQTEETIQKALEVLQKGRTTFVVAHRLSTVVRASKILVVHDGEVVESGTHEELLEIKGRYYKLWTSQTARGWVVER